MRTLPLSGSRRCSRSSSNVVLLLPLAPTTPTRSPRPNAQRQVRDQRALAVGFGDVLGVDHETRRFIAAVGADGGRWRGAEVLDGAVSAAHGEQFAPRPHCVSGAR